MDVSDRSRKIVLSFSPFYPVQTGCMRGSHANLSLNIRTGDETHWLDFSERYEEARND